MSLGTYPEVSLKEAREKCQEARKLIAEGVDPSQARKDAKAQAKEEDRRRGSTFEQVALEWHASVKEQYVEGHWKRLLARLQNMFFPSIGAISVAELKPQAIERVHTGRPVYAAMF